MQFLLCVAIGLLVFVIVRLQMISIEVQWIRNFMWQDRVGQDMLHDTNISTREDKKKDDVPHTDTAKNTLDEEGQVESNLTDVDEGASI